MTAEITLLECISNKAIQAELYGGSMTSEIKINPALATYHTLGTLSDLRRISFDYRANGAGKITIRNYC